MLTLLTTYYLATTVTVHSFFIHRHTAIHSATPTYTCMSLFHVVSFHNYYTVSLVSSLDKLLYLIPIILDSARLILAAIMASHS